MVPGLEKVMRKENEFEGHVFIRYLNLLKK